MTKKNRIITITIVLSLLILTFTSGCSDTLTGAPKTKTPSLETVTITFNKYFEVFSALQWTGSQPAKELRDFKIIETKMGKHSLKDYNNGQLPAPLSTYNSDCWMVQLHVTGVAVGKYDNKEYPFEDTRLRFLLCLGYEPNVIGNFYPEGFEVQRIQKTE